MRPFNLEEAKAGKPVCTRDGRNVRIICFDRRATLFPIIALVENKANGAETLLMYTNSGTVYINERLTTDNDLFMKPEKKEGWINVHFGDYRGYFGSNIFDTEESARTAALGWSDYKATTKIEWEE